ncbi:DHHC zinc finger domain-containing protein [Toxoplasma gondii ME49]|uniref:Palmitoyltransferase n=16 Tax=Toxoplasma gondii TaxID=5811 RepID=A0A125YWM5_TOXGV|nr:DHHC zinc finger domain-containing protein [Toxoplasma gondii ME49]EPR63153.1 DHHC zinc finger domain-containing protein [Toxoplasma gondii GT1]ESS34579.1 DHHC zinc finger domain-containing protein [Toxoplasma gondii VEG]KAF4638894.1 DHHC zinc finger domain-containing protein [Toxoplasma gondii]KFG31941.1 DHHC zinc finger domain-containing protein [Toxoplasma gondii p89]KFG34680.1 DHHC zinc finger domain-containing protein [Toxoplasma gondii GAB2-2007-GAL-DOM2]KFG46269.1 DHHC zinc finger d|eukprot:XP_002370588.1 DHHC zinc finger domain-containing protein [Toxoplasma gondii ME49]
MYHGPSPMAPGLLYHQPEGYAPAPTGPPLPQYNAPRGSGSAPPQAGMTSHSALSPRGFPPSPTNRAPTRVPVSGAAGTSRRSGNGCFLFAVVLLLSFLYLGYVFILLAPLLWPIPSMLGSVLFVAFHCSFVLLLGAFLKAVCTDPGRVPANWGFYMGDENKRRRYCKVCNVWKPDRTHHCSACGRCVLNMDHHCPWINNCVGFYNRKYFIQLLIYAIACLFFIFIHGFYFIFVESIRSTQTHPTALEHSVLSYEPDASAVAVLKYVYVCLMLFFSMVLIFALIPFSRFHLNLVLKNSTTIENMDVANRDRNRYDLGVSRNIEQVFGSNPCCWFVPVQFAANRPVGDGVRWNMHYMVADEHV